MFIRKKKILNEINNLRDRLDTASTIIDQLSDDLEDNRDSMKKIKSSVKEIQSEMEEYRNYKTEKALLKEGDEPWADFTTTLADDGRVKVEMDWNKAFIQHLKQQGMTANSEEDMVSIYFSSLVREAGDELTEEEVQKRVG